MHLLLLLLFYFLEDAGILNVDNELDLYSLQYVFLPIIQKQLDSFRHAWAHHHLRTERNSSPQQLWILGLQAMNTQDEQHPAVTGTSLVSMILSLSGHNSYIELG